MFFYKFHQIIFSPIFHFVQYIGGEWPALILIGLSDHKMVVFTIMNATMIVGLLSRLIIDQFINAIIKGTMWCFETV